MRSTVFGVCANERDPKDIAIAQKKQHAKTIISGQEKRFFMQILSITAGNPRIDAGD
jgi:hypothetical protein